MQGCRVSGQEANAFRINPQFRAVGCLRQLASLLQYFKRTLELAFGSARDFYLIDKLSKHGLGGYCWDCFTDRSGIFARKYKMNEFSILNFIDIVDQGPIFAGFELHSAYILFPEKPL